MAFSLVSNNGTHNYNYQGFVYDAPADIFKLSKKELKFKFKESNQELKL